MKSFFGINMYFTICGFRVNNLTDDHFFFFVFFAFKLLLETHKTKMFQYWYGILWKSVLGPKCIYKMHFISFNPSSFTI